MGERARNLRSRYRTRLDAARLRRSSRRLAIWLVVAAVIGAATGALVAGFQAVVLDVAWAHVQRWPLWALAVAPAVGLILATLVLRAFRLRRPDTAEEYIRVFHDRTARMRLRELPAKLVAGALTIGLGGSMGLEGPSLLSGGTLGDRTQTRYPRWFELEEAKVLLVAGGAAGISAVFKAPLTGLVFAMEVPYRDDIARHVLGPALVASATAYLVEAAARGVGPLVPIVGAGGFDLPDLFRSLALGLLVGLVGRLVVTVIRWVSRSLERLDPVVRLAVAAVVLAAIVLACDAIFGRPLALGPGEEAIDAAAVGGLSLVALLALLGLKLIATSVTAGAGGVGGLFFPLVVMGTALGAAFDRVLSGAHGSLLALVGMASLLGAAYHTPLAGVSFVAEATGRVGFIIPTFVATAAAYATIGSTSISARQRARRAGPIERMLDVPITDVLADAPTAVPEDTTVAAFIDGFALRHRQRAFPVVDDAGRYLGMMDIELAVAVPEAERASTLVNTVVDRTATVGRLTWTVREALEAMNASRSDAFAVVDERGHLVGALTIAEIFELDEILDRLRRDRGD
jgi:CIC family chloride channel protein